MKIYLVPLKFEDNDLLLELSAAIEQIISFEAIIYPRNISLYGGFDFVRNQLNSSWLLKQLKNHLPNGSDKVLGITHYDLFIPIFTFVFGEAEYNGQTAVISTHRFQNEFYGLEADKGILTERLIKESVHEIGHTLGLKHCRDIGCVMHSSSYVEEIDYKPYLFCDTCREFINSKLAH